MPIVVDGAFLEGGGQILRNSSAYSVILQKPIDIVNIRANRSKPGLRSQHLEGLKLLASLSGSPLEAQVGSTEVSLRPNTITSGEFEADTKTAGSICMLLQSMLPCCMFGSAPSHITLIGGTNASFAPQIDEYQHVFFPYAKQFGLNCQLESMRRGFFPRGQGRVVVSVDPVSSLKPCSFVTRGEVTIIRGIIFVAGRLPQHAQATIKKEALKQLETFLQSHPVQVDITTDTCKDAVGNGFGITLWAETTSGCRIQSAALGDKKISFAAAGAAAGRRLVENLASGCCVDEYTADQLIIFMALAVC